MRIRVQDIDTGVWHVLTVTPEGALIAPQPDPTDEPKTLTPLTALPDYDA